MTYKELQNKLGLLTNEQLQCDVAVELGITDEVFGAGVVEFRICGAEHDFLDEDHPVIYVGEA